MKFLFISIVFLSLIGCSVINTSDTLGRVEYNSTVRSVLVTIYGEIIVSDMESNTYWVSDEKLNEIAGYPVNGMFNEIDGRIYISSNLRNREFWQDDTLVHEATHFYQIKKLHMSSILGWSPDNNIDRYTIPNDLTNKIGIEAEAELVVKFAANLLPRTYMHTTKSIHEKYRLYLIKHMGLAHL